MIYEEAKSELSSILLDYKENTFDRVQELFAFMYGSMDWNYEYSDDHSVWTKYSNRAKELEHFHARIYVISGKKYNYKQQKFI